MPLSQYLTQKTSKTNSLKSKILTRKFYTYIPLTGKEVRMEDDELIVSKTDISGKITYANEVFTRMAAITEEEVIGAPHSIIRHPQMPRVAFKLLWDKLQSGQEVFAYVLNMAKTGDEYWVFAHVTPSFDNNGKIIGYHSNRRAPDRKALETIKPIYKNLLEIENKERDARLGISNSYAALGDLLKQNNTNYERFILSI